MEKDQVYHILGRAYFSEEPHEKETLRRLAKMLRSATVFVDVGASLGQYVYHANKHLRGGHILAIEPDPIRFNKLEENCHEWESLSDNRIRALHAAVSDIDGITKFYTTNSPVSGGLFKHDLSHVGDQLRQVATWEEVVVECFRLDNLLEDMHPDLIKIDVEGSELRVLRGCTRLLKDGKARFLVEIHGWADPEGQKDPAAVFDLMRSFGYWSTNQGGRYLFAKRTKMEAIILLCGMQVKGLLSCIGKWALPLWLRHRLWALWQRHGY